MTKSPPFVLQGHAYDGTSSCRKDATLKSGPSQFVLAYDDQIFTYKSQEVKFSSPIANLPRIFSFPDNRCFETDNNELADSVSRVTREGDHTYWIHRVESSWKISVIFVCFFIALMLSAYFFLVPAISDRLALLVPQSWIQHLGRETEKEFDRLNILMPGTLDSKEKLRWEKVSRQLLKMFPNKKIKLSIREGKDIGPNALALPNGSIYVTDEIIGLMENDDQLLAVLMHEVGHLEKRHSLKLLIENSALSLFIVGVVGAVDWSSLPLLILTNSYSRDFEKEADAFAALELKKNGLSPKLLAEALQKLETKVAKSSSIPNFLSTHPLNRERLRFLTEYK